MTANAQIVTLYAIDAGKSTEAGTYFAPPAGTTEKYDVSNAPFGPSTASHEVVQFSLSTVSSMSSAITGNKQRNWVSQVIALRSVSPLTEGLAHYWRLDELSGDAFDSVGSMTMTNINSTSFVSGKIGRAVDFERDFLNVIRTTIDATNSTLTGYTFCNWYKPESLPPPGQAYAFWGMYDTPAFLDFLYVNPGPGFGPNYLMLRHYPTVELKHFTDFSLGTFYHLCTTWDGAFVSMYLNGEGVAGPVAVNAVQTNATYGTSIGAQPYEPNTNHNDGIIDEVGFWTRALSTSEISQLYNGGAGRSYPF